MNLSVFVWSDEALVIQQHKFHCNWVLRVLGNDYSDVICAMQPQHVFIALLTRSTSLMETRCFSIKACAG